MVTAQGGSAKHTAGTVDQALEQIRLNRRTHQSRANSSFMITYEPDLEVHFPLEKLGNYRRLLLSSVGRAKDFKHLHQALMLGLGNGSRMKFKATFRPRLAVHDRNRPSSQIVKSKSRFDDSRLCK
ncbi:hypothetical protein PGT21_005277 [Puccinia graminis f. sp. tritici]|uniref:Uncharacterized protein n=1 Tax=Puccinia graminis f. sp. tritici TaxID=56615 RepID=A0A5B0PFF7_PUCGR|nr:hypothetical protein PGT21_005277 [Puccinia graminis f. sp. tritici]